MKKTALIIAAVLISAALIAWILQPKPAPKNPAEPVKRADTVQIDTVPAEPDSSVCWVKPVSLNLRSAPDSTGKRVSELKKGTVLTVKDRDSSGSWLKVACRESDTGWVQKKYVVWNKIELLPESIQKLDFAAQVKNDTFPENPRVKAKGVYVTIYTAEQTKKFSNLIAMMKRNGLNTMVIDVKDDAGRALFQLASAETYAPEANSFRTIRDLSGFIKKLKDNGIYLIARIVCFKDPIYSKANPDKAILVRKTGEPFISSDGLAWASAFDTTLWNYNIAVAKECADSGFNEIQFDYVRFPDYHDNSRLDFRSDGSETKAQAIQNFLKKAYSELSSSKVYVSADIFGLVASVEDDMQIGQYWESISSVVDYVCPMMYPSHYHNGTLGIAVPDAVPYKTISRSIRDCIKRNKNSASPAVIRPWIQDFTAKWVRGYISYGEPEIRAQIKALEEQGVDEFLLWNAANRYTDMDFSDKKTGE